MYDKAFYDQTKFPIISVLRRKPNAVAKVKGSADLPQLSGLVSFYQTNAGVIVCAEIIGLAKSEEPCGGRIFAFHIHDGDECTGNHDDPFANTGKHFDPNGCAHPYHAGDLPSLFESSGLALSVFLTDRFCVREVIGKTVIIHDSHDDFTTQPSGNSGKKIACGVIRPNDRR